MRALPLAILAAALCAGGALAAFPPLKRVPLLDQPLSADIAVHRVKVARIDFAPGQPTGYHLHPVPAISLVTKGSFVFQVQGQPARTLREGDVAYEPANQPIAHYDNASTTQPARIAVTYLVGADANTPLIEMLPGQPPR